MPDPINVPTPPSRRRGDMTPPRRGATNNRGRITLGTPPSVPSAPGTLPDLGNIPGPWQHPGRAPETAATPRRTPANNLKVPGLAPSRGPVRSPDRVATPDRPVRQEKVVNQYDDGEDPFEQIPVQDQVDVEDYEDYEAERVEVDTTPERQPSRRASASSNADSIADDHEDATEPAPKKKGIFGRKSKGGEPASKKHTKSSAPAKASTPSILDDDEDELGFKRNFVDKKNKRLLPFGKNTGSTRDRRKGRKVRDKDIDPRKNRIVKINGYRIFFVTACLAVVALGGYKAIFPQKALTVDETAQVAQQALGRTNFPEARGEGFAKDFLQAYLTTSDDTSQQALAYFFNGTLENANNSSVETNRQASANYKQQILYGPTVYSASSVTDQVATYVVGALVKAAPADGSTPAPDSNGKTGGEATWMFYSINVFYDKASDRLFITPDSPTVVPNMNVGSSRDLPGPQSLGTGDSDSDLKAKVSSTVLGFMSAYATSSPQDHTALDQYVVNDAPQELKTGLSGTYSFDGNVNNAVTFEAFPTKDANVAKVKVTVNWKRSLGANESQSARYTSTYVMTLQNVSGKWQVSKFSPFTYLPDESESVSNSAGDQKTAASDGSTSGS